MKPIGRFLARLSGLEEQLSPGARIAVVGAGAGGTELALALARRYRGRVHIVLVCDASEPLASAPAYARSVARAALVDAGVELACGVRAGAWANGRLPLSDGSFLDVEATLWATGVVGPPWLAASGLACDAVGCVQVRRRCRASAMPLFLPRAIVRRSRVTQGREPVCGRCAPVRHSQPIFGEPPQGASCIAGGHNRMHWPSWA